MRAIDQQRTRGFTLIELMIAIVIVAILAAFALPSMNNLVLKHRVQDAASDLFATLFKARSEALRLADTVKVQPATGTDWTTGWTITHLNSVTSTTDIIDKHEPVQKATAGQRGMSVTFTGTSPIVYTATGRVSSSAPSFQISATSGGYSCTYKVAVDPTGRPYETTIRASSGTGVASGGGVPSC
jgi:prepilin-type N-terminal cleavage/methylation domain-containing protein